MGVNKVDFCGKTLIDLSSDTIVPEKMLEGTTAHAADGEPIVGTMSAASGGGPIESPLVVPFSVDGAGSSTGSLTCEIPIAVKKPSKLVIKKLSLYGGLTSSLATTNYLYFRIKGTKEDGTTGYIKSYVYTLSSAAASYKIYENEEIDLSGYESVEKIIIDKGKAGKTTCNVNFSVTGSLELYF